MASNDSQKDEIENKRERRRKQVLVGDLPSDFLRVTPLTAEQQLALDEQAALALQQQLSGNSIASAVAGRLTISVIEAKLNKNYGLTRMDPYVRLTIGQAVYETNTDYNGAKNPRWNKTFNCFFFSQDTSIHIEMYDECAFSLDEKIAWACYEIPESVQQGETMNEWIELSGKLGEGKEGVINLVITCQPIPSGTLIYQSQPIVAVVPYGTTPEHPVQNVTLCQKSPHTDMTDSNSVTPEEVEMSEEDFKQVREMFPNIEEEVVRTVMDSNGGNKTQTINALIELSEGT